jgi:uncharacterized protein (TIGR03435 family)
MCRACFFRGFHTLPRRLTVISMIGAVSMFLMSSFLQSQTTTSERKLEFEVASVRENRTGETPYSNFPLNQGPQFDAKGGLLMARDQLLLSYIVFAFKPDMFQIQRFRDQLPTWTRTRYDIEARADGNPTKDDMRLMMQSLLEDRFHLVFHHETREETAYAMVLVKPATLGPRIMPHPADDPECAKDSIPKPLPGAFNPLACGASASVAPKLPGDFAVAGFNVTMNTIALGLGGAANLTDRQVIDRTGLTGSYDFALEFAPEQSLTARPDASADYGPGGPSFTEAVKDQLGIKLIPQKLPVDVIVIDHIEKPSQN